MRINAIFTREFFIVLPLGAEWDFSDSEMCLAIIYVEVVDVGFHTYGCVGVTDVPIILRTGHGLV